MDQHEYPSDYGRGVHWATDAAWEILDTIKPGIISVEVRAFLAGQIAGRLAAERERRASSYWRLHRDIAFLKWLVDECGYLHPTPLPDGRWAAVAPKMFTHAIVTGRMGDHSGIEQNWCYETRELALAALEAWDGTGEPQGWLRATHTGERISRSPDEKDENGKEVGAIGVRYRRN